jgi:hypothetical protein
MPLGIDKEIAISEMTEARLHVEESAFRKHLIFRVLSSLRMMS